MAVLRIRSSAEPAARASRGSARATPAPVPSAGRRRERGISLIETMIALAILLVGLVPLLRLQIFGMASNSGARSHMIATHLAEELVSGIERLAFADPLVKETEATGPTPPATFLPIVNGLGAVVEAGAHRWNDSTHAIPSVRTDADLIATYGEEAPGKARYERRWRVYGYSPGAGGTATVKIVAVSVVWREPSLPRPREVVLYTELHNPSALLNGLNANL